MGVVVREPVAGSQVAHDDRSSPGHAQVASPPAHAADEFIVQFEDGEVRRLGSTARWAPYHHQPRPVQAATAKRTRGARSPAVEIPSSCAICLNDFAEMPADTQLLRLRCNHMFCVDCVQSWWSAAKKSCPVCRTVSASLRSSVALSAGELVTETRLNVSYGEAEGANSGDFSAPQNRGHSLSRHGSTQNQLAQQASAATDSTVHRHRGQPVQTFQRGDKLTVKFNSEWFPGIVVDFVPAGQPVLNGNTNEAEFAPVLRGNEFIVFFSADRQYWRLNAASHRKVIRRVVDEYKSSTFRGVSWSGTKWRARMQIAGAETTTGLGRFTNEVDAAQAYDTAVRKIEGNYPLNFPTAAEETRLKDEENSENEEEQSDVRGNESSDTSSSDDSDSSDSDEDGSSCVPIDSRA
eukprot:COSAG01_NODE_8266_length_2851_cov_9.645349_3_plen_406_part_01